MVKREAWNANNRSLVSSFFLTTAFPNSFYHKNTCIIFYLMQLALVTIKFENSEGKHVLTGEKIRLLERGDVEGSGWVSELSNSFFLRSRSQSQASLQILASRWRGNTGMHHKAFQAAAAQTSSYLIEVKGKHSGLWCQWTEVTNYVLNINV